MILATFAVIEQLPRAVELLNIVFVAVMLSAALQGSTVHALAARMWPPGRQPARAPG